MDWGGAAPWTSLEREFVHPNGSNNGEQHWAIRRWVVSELSAATTLAVTWNVRKQNLSGNGVTGALHLNGARVQSATIAGADGTGVTNVYYLNAKPTDILDLILSPVGPDGSDADGSDGSYNWMIIETTPDTDSDGLPDAWENLFFPGDLTQLSATGDKDADGLKDPIELQKNSNPTQADTDDDGLNDGVETNTGIYVSPTDTGTDPLRADTDSDGRKDGDEIKGNPQTNPFDSDSDDDNYLEGEEVAGGLDPNNLADNAEATAIANSTLEFSGIPGQEGWSFGYRDYTKDGGGENYNATVDFIPFAGGDGLGDWDGTTQQWTGSGWDLNTAAAAPWTELGSEAVHPNGTNSAPNDFEHWVIRRWMAKKLTKPTPVALIWLVKKENPANAGVTGLLFLNGKRLDSKTIVGTDTQGEVRRYYVNLKPNDIVDLALSPEGPGGDRYDWSDGSIDWLWVDTRIPPNPKQPDGTPFIVAGQVKVSGVYQAATGQFVLTWASETGLKYTVWASPDLKVWTAIKAGLDSGGASSSYSDTLGSPVPAFRFYEVSQP